ncbi:MAG: Uma2 family endonuclease [Pseudonocardia sp.]
MAADPVIETRLFSVEEYELMGRLGVLNPEERLELLDGRIVPMSPVGPEHASVVDVLAELLILALDRRASVRVQNPVRLPPRSEPEPDIVVARRRRDRYRSAHPTAEDALLVVEVADSSLRRDRLVKLPIYARQGVAEVWIVDLAADVVHVHTDPAGEVYRDVRTVARGDSVTPVALPDLTLAVADVLGG